jgi:hypothetical protein
MLGRQRATKCASLLLLRHSSTTYSTTLSSPWTRSTPFEVINGILKGLDLCLWRQDPCRLGRCWSPTARSWWLAYEKWVVPPRLVKQLLRPERSVLENLKAACTIVAGMLSRQEQPPIYGPATSWLFVPSRTLLQCTRRWQRTARPILISSCIV